MIRYLLTQRKYFLLALLAGALLPLAFAPFNFFILAFLAPALLGMCWWQSDAREAFWQGGLFGLGFFTVGCSWIYISVHTYGNAPAIIAFLITLIFIVVQAILYFGVQGYLFKKCCARIRAPYLQCLVLFPFLWLLFELIRSAWPFGGFPWLLLGYSELNTWLAGWAPILSVYGLSFWVALTAGALMLIFRRQWRNSQKTWLPVAIVILLLAIWVAGYFLKQKTWVHNENQPIKVALMQGNIPQALKWNPATATQALELYSQLSEKNWNRPLIVWPEAAVAYYPEQVSYYLNLLHEQARQHASTIITGIPFYQNGNYFNGVLVMGNGTGQYLKRHLVPFGEYYPMKWLLNSLLHFLEIPLSDLTAGPAVQENLIVNIDGSVVQIAPAICYEIAYPILMAKTARTANLLLTISDDSWFGKSIARAQHLQIAQMRSLELNRPQLFVSNSGITAIIDAKGKIVAMLPVDQVGVLNGIINPTSGETPLVHIL